MKNHMKGQMSIRNMVALAMGFLMYGLVVIPVLKPVIAQVIIDLGSSPNEFTVSAIAIVGAVPFLFLLWLVITGFMYATQPSQGGY